MTKEQFERVMEAIVTQIERAETPEAVIRLLEILSDFQRQKPTDDY